MHLLALRALVQIEGPENLSQRHTKQSPSPSPDLILSVLTDMFITSSPCGRQLLLGMFIFLGYQELRRPCDPEQMEKCYQEERTAKCPQSKV